MALRDRVLTTLAHRQPDMCPWQISLTQDARDRVSAYLHDAAFDADSDLWLGNHLAVYEDGWFVEERPGYWRDQFGVLWNRTVDRDIGVVDRYLLPEPSFSGYTFPSPDLARNAAGLGRLLAENPDRFTVAAVGFSLFERAWTLRGMEDLLADMVLHPAFVEALLDRILEYNLDVIEQIVACSVDCIYFGDDWGQQKGLIMGPRHWRRFIKPRLAQMYARAKSAGKFVTQHSCGDVQELFPDLIEIGLDVFNTFQPEVMDVDLMKRQYGRDLTFYGGISTQRALPYMDVPTIRGHVREMIARLGGGGGYVVAPTHAIPRDVPPENIVALAEQVREQ